MISAWQLAVGRVSVGLNVAQLAELADIAPNSIHSIERGCDFRASTMRALEEALEARGCLFASGRVGVRMVWEGKRPESREIREGVLAILNATRRNKGQAPYIDIEDA